MAEKEYIERDKAVNVVVNNPYRIALKTCKTIAEIKEIPAADVVEVVRCKDCKNKKEDILTNDIMWCCRFAESVKPDGFCSFGKREEQE